MKPRIRMDRSLWVCSSGRTRAYGYTPADAYFNWSIMATAILGLAVPPMPVFV